MNHFCIQQWAGEHQAREHLRKRGRPCVPRTAQQLADTRVDFESGMQRDAILKKHRVGALRLSSLAVEFGWQRPPMRKTGRAPILSPAAKDVLRFAYENDKGQSIAAIGRQFCVHARTVYGYAEREDWVRPFCASPLSVLKGGQRKVYDILRRYNPRSIALRDAMTVRP